MDTNDAPVQLEPTRSSISHLKHQNMQKQDSISLWNASAQERDYRASMNSDSTVDVAIVGGGFTGLSTALHCAEQGLSAHVLEARQIGYGGSGRKVGHVNAGGWLPPKGVRDRLGSSSGSRFLKTFGQGPDMVFSLIEKHQIRCEVTKTGTIHAAHSMNGFADLEERWKEWNAMGESVDLLNRDEVSKLIGSNAFHGGLVNHRAGTINPPGILPRPCACGCGCRRDSEHGRICSSAAQRWRALEG